MTSPKQGAGGAEIPRKQARDLTDDEVRAIRAVWPKGESYAGIGARFGVQASVVSAVVRRRVRRDVPEEAK